MWTFATVLYKRAANEEFYFSAANLIELLR